MGGVEQRRPLPSDIPYTNLAPVMLFSLQPATNYSLRTLAVYPNNDEMYTDPVFFVTLGMYLK